MIRQKGFFFVLFAAVAALVALVASGIGIAGKSSQAFAGDGYVLSPEAAMQSITGTEEVVKTEPLYFAAGTSYRSKYPQSMVFKDVQGTKRTIDYYSFIHYADESVSALTDGILVNMDDIGMGMVNHYSLRAGVVMSANGDGYTVENNGNQINFHSFIWKLSDSTFLLSSDELVLNLPDGTQEVLDGFVEAHYIEDGIIRLTDKEHQWQVVGDGTVAALSNGVTYDFGDRIIRDANGVNCLTYQELLLHADDNIQVQSAQDWVAPEFDFEVIDGQDGQDGEAGEDGTSGIEGVNGVAGQKGEDGAAGQEGNAGDDGEAGEEGESGESGRDGNTGTSGVNGASGEQGAAGSVTDKETMAQATFSITDFELTAGSLSVTFTVIDDDGVLGTAGSVKLLDAQGNSIDDWTSPELNPDENGELEFSGDAEYTVSWDNLNPDTQYRLVVSSSYVLKSVNGQRDYINRTFYTDSSGMQLEKLYATEDGFGMELTRKSYSESSGAQITILDASGNEMMNYNVSAGEFDDDGVLELSTDTGFTVNQNLSSNTSYVIKLQSVVNGTLKDNGNRQTWKTLKKKPTLGIAEGYANSQTYFNLSVKDVTDEDSAIVEYRYDVYKAGSTTITKTITSTSNKSVALYIDDTILRGQSYQVMVTAAYYDNEKTAEVQTELSESFIMGDAGEISVSFEWADGADKITELEGTLRIDPKNAGTIGISSDKPLTVQIESSGYYKRVLEFDNAAMSTYLINDVYNIPLHLYGLKQSSSYRISVWGYILNSDDPLNPVYVYQLLGDYVVSTTSHAAIPVDIVAANNGSTVGTYIYLGDEYDYTDPADYNNTLKSIRAVEVKLYSGSTVSAGNLVATTLAVDDALTPNNPYQNTIASTYYGANGRNGNEIYVDESTFLKTAGDLTASQYCISISAIYDYTYHYVYENDEIVTTYYNTIPFDTGSISTVVLNVSNRLPDFPTPQTTGVEATPIYFADLGDYGITAADVADADMYMEDTIVGYKLNGRFDNSGALAKTVTYYAFTQADLNEYKADTDPSKGEDVMTWRQAQIGTLNRPWMKVTVPVSSTSTGLTTIAVLFMDPPAGTTPISNMDTSLKTEEATENSTDSISGIHDEYLNGTTPTFFAKNLERGWSYMFSYTTRLDYQGSNDYKYPNNYTGRFISGQTLLSTTAQHTPRQKSGVKMYLYQTFEEGTNAIRGYADWRYKYTDLDGVATMEFGSIGSYNDIQTVFAATDGGSNLLSAPDNPSLLQDGYKNLRVRVTGNINYVIQMKQDFYDSNNEYNDNGDKYDSEMRTLAECQFTIPILPSSVTGNDGIEVAWESPGQGNTLRFTFGFGSSVTGIESRIERVTIWAIDQSGQTISGSSQTFYSFDGTNTSSLKYINYDLSRAGSVGDTVDFQVSIVYDSGYAGDHYVINAGADDRFTIQTNTGQYLVRMYNNTGSGLSNSKSSSAWYSSYRVIDTSPTSSEADQAWMIINTHSAYQSESNADYPQPVINLRYDAGGAYDVVEGNYPIFKLLDTQTFSCVPYTINSLIPSIYSIGFTKGLTTIKGSFTTNTYQLIETTSPTGLTAGKYIHVTLTRYENDDPSGALETAASWDGYVEITSVDQAATYSFLADQGLVSGGYYRVELTCVPNGGGSEVTLWDTSENLSAIYSVQLLDSMNITNMAFSSIQYITYQNKYVTLSYQMDLTSGFEIQYSLEILQSNGSYTSYKSHNDVMEAMGYDWDGTNWIKTATGGPWTISSYMAETISLSPGSSIMSPGNTYRLTVKAVDSAGSVVGENSTVFTWPVLSKPSFYVTTTPGSLGTGISVKLEPIDTNKVIVEGEYYVVLWEGDTIKYFDSFGVEDGLQSGISISNLAANTSYELCIFASLDMDNAGSSALGLSQADLENMTSAQRAALLIYQSTERTMEAWGGRYDSLNVRFNSSKNIRIEMFNAYNLDLIDEIRVTVYKDSVSKNFTLTKSSSETSLFSSIGSSATDYYTVVTAGGSLTDSGVYSVTCSFMKNGAEQFRETKSVVMD